MNFRFPRKNPFSPADLKLCYANGRRRFFNSVFSKLKITSQTRTFCSSGSSSFQGAGSKFLVPGATAATILMLGALHARRMYNDKKIEEAREKGIELEFRPDVKASFMQMLPLRSISRAWGFMTGLELPVWLRPRVYKAWSRAFHSNLEEAALPLDKYPSLRDFFVRRLREGCRPIDTDPYSLISPVDGTVLRFGEITGAGAMIEQVKGFSYSVSSLLGASPFLPRITEGDSIDESPDREEHNTITEKSQKLRWRFSLASPNPNVPQITKPARPMKGLYYCVLYLAPGDYHRIHSPVDWNVLVRRHFTGRLFPVNERATRTIRNLYVENERVVLEGRWREGYMAIAAVGATNIGSVELSIEPDLRTNKPRKKILPLEPPEERVYEPEGVGLTLKKGDDVGAFNMGSTVVLVFEAPSLESMEKGDPSSEFKFSIRRGDRIRMGEALGKWH